MGSTAKDAGQTVGRAGQTVGRAGQSVGRAATSARVPLVAAGAALAGAAGGLAWGARHSGKHRMFGVIPPRPRVKVKSRDVAKAAKEVGSFGAQMGHLASELQAARENGAKNGSKHRSPIEVVLDGLTARH